MWAAPSACSPSCTARPAPSLPSPCALPGDRRRRIGRRPASASGAQRLSGSVHGPCQARARQARSGAGPAPPRSGLARGDMVEALGCPLHCLGGRRSGRTALPGRLRLPCCDHQHPHRWPRPEGVTFRHKHRASNRWRTTRLSGHEFMRRFLQHVLPKGLHKVRYYGLWHWSRREHAAQARLLLELQRRGRRGRTVIRDDRHLATGPAATPCPERRACPCCKHGHLRVSGVSTPSRRADHERQGQPSQSRPLFRAHVRVARRPTLVRGPVRRSPLGRTPVLTAQTLRPPMIARAPRGCWRPVSSPKPSFDPQSAPENSIASRAAACVQSNRVSASASRYRNS